MSPLIQTCLKNTLLAYLYARYPLKWAGPAKKERAGKWKYLAVIMDYKPDDYTAFYKFIVNISFFIVNQFLEIHKTIIKAGDLLLGAG